MDLLFGLVIAGSIAAIAWSTWTLICSSKTYKQRLWLLNRKPMWNTMDGQAFWREFDSVTFDAHLKAIKRRRDPFALYGPIIQNMAKQYHA